MNRTLSSCFVGQGVGVIFVGCLTGLTLIFDARVGGSDVGGVDFSINTCTQQSCAVYCKVLVSRVKATKLLSGFVTMAE